MIAESRSKRRPWTDAHGRASVLKATTFVGLFVPAVWIAIDFGRGAYGFLPGSFVIYWSGVWALILLLAALSISVLATALRLPRLRAIRRMLGVAAFAYSAGHLMVWLIRDIRIDGLSQVGREMLTRPTLILATIALLGLATMAATSTDQAVARMGGPAWRFLQRGGYLWISLAALHFLMSPGSTGGLPFLMAGLLIYLLLWRGIRAGGGGGRPSTLAAVAIVAAMLSLAFEIAWLAFWRDVQPGLTLAVMRELWPPVHLWLGLTALGIAGLASIRSGRR